MGTAAFQKDVLIEIERRPYRLLRQIDKGLWQMEDMHTGQLKETSTDDLNRDYAAQRLIFISEKDQHLDQKLAEKQRKREEVALIELDPEELQRMREHRAYVMGIEDLPATEKILVPAIRQTWEKLGSKGKPPHWITVLRWKRQFISHGRDGHALRKQDYRKGNRQRRHGKQLLRIINDAIEKVYLTRERKTVADTLNHAIVATERENRQSPESLQLPLPTRRLVQSSINAIDAFDRHAARFGHLAAVRKYRSVLHMNVSDRPLECAEMDHTQLDLIVVDDETGMPLGRPWVTVCIDRHTRCILGIYLSFTPPSFLTVARALKLAFMPKIDLRENYPEIDHEWRAHGVMQKLVVDNGMEFHSESLESLCLALGIDLQYTPRKTPWWKGQVERFMGTLNGALAHGNPGSTFKNILDKDDYDPVSTAAIGFSRLKMHIHKFITDVYHQRPHRSLDGMAPAAMWDASIRDEDILLPNNLAHLDAILGRVHQRQLTHKGLEYQGLFYNSPELSGLRRRLGDKLTVELRVDEGDLGHLYVIAPDKSESFKVPCLNQDYAAGLSEWQHKVCRRNARLRFDLGDNPNAWRHAKEAIAELVRNDLLRSKKRTNAKAARYMHPDVQQPRKAEKALKPTPIRATPDALIITAPDAPVQPTPTPPAFKALIVSRPTTSLKR